MAGTNCGRETHGGYCDCMIVNGEFKGAEWVSEMTIEEIKAKYKDGWWEGHDGYTGDDMYADIEILLAEIERLSGK